MVENGDPALAHAGFEDAHVLDHFGPVQIMQGAAADQVETLLAQGVRDEVGILAGGRHAQEFAIAAIADHQGDTLFHHGRIVRC